MGMWGSSDDETASMFRAQFERDGDRYLFRYGKRSAPVAVTVQEMEESIAAFRRRIRWVTRGGVSVMMAAIFAFVLSGSDFLDRDGAIWLLVLVWTVPFMIAFVWAWRSPTRRFMVRVPIGRERTRSEVRADMLSEWGWSKIILPLGGGLLLVTYRIANWPPTTIEGWIWLGLGLFLALVSTANAIMKLRVRRL
jgi:hypothetical protein